MQIKFSKSNFYMKLIRIYLRVTCAGVSEIVSLLCRRFVVNGYLANENSLERWNYFLIAGWKRSTLGEKQCLI